MTPSPVNALSIDLEDWWHAELVRRHLVDEPTESRVVGSTVPVLELLARYHVRATFFVVGDVMRRHPDLIRRVYEGGHEIGCHGMSHRPLWELTPESFHEELAAFDQLSRRVLGTAARIRGFRAPTFSLDRRTRWALPLLVKRGYQYDASVFPVRGPLYGLPEAPLGIYPLGLDDPAREDPGGPLLEFPPATYPFRRWRIPVGGGAYLRLAPRALLLRLLKGVGAKQPFLLYIHPWETDPEIPRVRLPVWAGLVTYYGIGSALKKLELLLQTFRFTTLHESLEAWQRRLPRRPKSPAATESKGKRCHPSVLVVIPACNEARNLAAVIHGVRAVAPGAGVLVVNDGSTDDTATVARMAGAQVLSHAFNLGYGAALQTGFLYALARGYDYMVQLDGDGQHDPRDVRRILDTLLAGEADVVVGSRYLPRAPEWTGWLRRRGSQALARMTSWIIGRRITDSASGFQGCNRRVAKFYTQDSYPGDYPDADVLIMLHRAGFRIREIPVTMHGRTNGRSMHSGIRLLYYVYKMTLAMILTLMRQEKKPGWEEA